MFKKMFVVLGLLGSLLLGGCGVNCSAPAEKSENHTQRLRRQ